MYTNNSHNVKNISLKHTSHRRMQDGFELVHQ